MTDPAEELDLVLLELHPGAAAEPEPTACERRRDVLGRHLDAGRQTLDRREEGRAVGLTCGQPAKHVQILPCTRGGRFR